MYKDDFELERAAREKLHGENCGLNDDLMKLRNVMHMQRRHTTSPYPARFTHTEPAAQVSTSLQPLPPLHTAAHHLPIPRPLHTHRAHSAGQYQPAASTSTSHSVTPPPHNPPASHTPSPQRRSVPASSLYLHFTQRHTTSP